MDEGELEDAAKIHGSLDEANRQFVRGWAAWGRRPVEVTTSVGGKQFRVSPNADRPDFLALCLRLRSGFIFIFPELLAEGNSVKILLPSGKSDPESPFVYAEADLCTTISGGNFQTFSGKLPSHQNPIDMFGDVWVSAMPGNSGLQSGGIAEHFADPRPRWAGSILGSFNGKSILELEPFEGHASFHLEKVGAEVLSIEGDLIKSPEIPGHQEWLLALHDVPRRDLKRSGDGFASPKIKEHSGSAATTL